MLKTKLMAAMLAILTAGAPVIEATSTREVSVTAEGNLTLNKTQLYMDVNEEVRLTAYRDSVATVSGLTWKSSDYNIANVDMMGVVTARKEGYATITVTSSDGISAVCQINVLPAKFIVDGITYIANLDNATARVGNPKEGFIHDSELYEQNNSYNMSYSGALTIPSEVSRYSKTYRVTDIGIGAFYGCDELTSVSLPASVSGISHHAFAFCKGLKDIILPDSVEEIGEYAFYTSGLRKAMLMNNECSVAKTAFKKSVERYTCKPGTAQIVDNIVYTDNLTTAIYAPVNAGDTVELAPSTKAIGANAFKYCTLQAIDFPEGLTAIGKGAFSQCTVLTELTMPETLDEIGAGAFEDCSFIKWVKMPRFMSGIGESAFSGCTHLMSINLPEGIEAIADRTFYQCRLDGVAIPESVKSIGDYAFFCDQPYSFGKEAVFGSNVEFIGEHAFEGWQMKQIALPPTLKSIGAGAFAKCRNLSEVSVLAVIPPSCADDAFQGVNVRECVLIVPAESIDAYRDAEVWKNFLLQAGIGEVGAEAAATVIYDLQGRRISNPRRGQVYIVNGRKLLL